MDDLLVRVPKSLRGQFGEIVTLIDRYCAAHLNDEYRDLCRACAADACAAGVSFGSGKAAGWAAGIVSAVAYANFLGSDPSQPFHTSPGDMAKRAGVSPATMQNKSKAIRDALGIDRFDPRYSTQRINDDNPFIWLLSVNGIVMDIRKAPRGAQEAAFRQGLIPYVPADGPPSTPISGLMATQPKPAPRRTRSATGLQRARTAQPMIYTLDVILTDGPITKEFAEKNRSVIRTIEIRGDQTLDDLHEAIFDAFDRDDPHMYEFQFGKGTRDRNGPRYVMPEALEHGDEFGPPIAGVTTETTMEDLKLKVGRHFGYWFDFGDDWRHQIDVVSISEGAGKGEYPRLTKRIGESPPQYIDWDEEG